VADASVGIHSVTAFDAVFTAERLAHPWAAEGALEPSIDPRAGGAETVLAVAAHGRVYLRGAAGIIHRQGMDTLLFRAWLFGVLTFLESRARERIRRDPDWREALSPGRLAKARSLKQERARRGRDIGTVDALQFGDLGWIAARYTGWYALFGVESKRQAKQLVRRLEALRNNVAHGQSGIGQDWDTIVVVAQAVRAIAEAEMESGGPTGPDAVGFPGDLDR
jgi:hypothetical protein